MVPVWAYLDAGSGSMLMQLLVGGLAGAGVVVRFYGRSMMRLLHKPAETAEPRSDAETPAPRKPLPSRQ